MWWNIDTERPSPEDEQGAYEVELSLRIANSYSFAGSAITAAEFSQRLRYYSTTFEDLKKEYEYDSIKKPFSKRGKK